MLKSLTWLEFIMELYIRAIIGSMAFSLVSLLIIFLLLNLVLSLIPYFKSKTKFTTLISFLMSWILIGLIVPAFSLQYFMDNTYYLYSLELVLSLVTIILFTFCGKQKIINKWCFFGLRAPKLNWLHQVGRFTRRLSGLGSGTLPDSGLLVLALFFHDCNHLSRSVHQDRITGAMAKAILSTNADLLYT